MHASHVPCTVKVAGGEHTSELSMIVTTHRICVPLRLGNARIVRVEIPLIVTFVPPTAALGWPPTVQRIAIREVCLLTHLKFVETPTACISFLGTSLKPMMKFNIWMCI